jgi:tetratricopeptide (TPR) repeat protein
MRLAEVLILVMALFSGASLAGDPPAGRAAKAKEALARGQGRLEKSDPQGAIPDLSTAVDLAPEDVEARFSLGFAYFLTGDYRRARAELEAALDRDPRCGPALEYLGRIDYLEGDLERALRLLGKALATAPERRDLADLVAKIENERKLEASYAERFTLHFRLKVEGGRDEAQVADRIADALERAYSEVGYDLGHFPIDPIPVILYSDRDFYALTGTHGWVGGLFDGKIRIPIKGLSLRDEDSLRRIARHEYVHACVHTLAPRCPTWLQEGLAQHFEGLRFEPGGLIERRDALPSFANLGGSFVREKNADSAKLLYAQSLGFVEFLIARRGTSDLAEVLRDLGAGKALDDAIERVYGEKLAALEASWRATLK